MSVKKNSEDKVLLLNRLYERFEANLIGWEEVDNKDEYAAIEANGYILKNKDIHHWHHFSLFMLVPEQTGLYMRAIIEVDPESGPGQFGLLWGYNEKVSRLNRFCLSAAGKGTSIVHFERNHRPVFYRYYDHFTSFDTRKPVLLEIREHKGYFCFSVNRRTVYLAHCSHFADLGNGVGFYLDPGVSIRVKKFQVAQLVSPNTTFSLP